MILPSVMVTYFGISNQIEQGATAAREEEEQKNKAGCNSDSDRAERGAAKLLGRVKDNAARSVQSPAAAAAAACPPPE